MKEYLDFEDGNIISANEDYLDFIDEDISGILDVNENDDYISYDLNKETFESVAMDDYNLEYLNILNVKEKKYLDGNYNYKEETQKIEKINKKNNNKKNKKNKKTKKYHISFTGILNKSFKYILFLFRVLFIIILFCLIMLILLFKGKENDIIKEQEKLSNSKDILIEATISNISESKPLEYNNFILLINEYSNDLVEIINGENLIIGNFKNNIINQKDVYNYFSKTLKRKEELLLNFNNLNFNTEFNDVTNLLKQMIINSENLSKQIMNRYLVGDSNSEIISDMTSYYEKFLRDYNLLYNYLGTNN